jgi:hypothetical protein
VTINHTRVSQYCCPFADVEIKEDAADAAVDYEPAGDDDDDDEIDDDDDAEEAAVSDVRSFT